MERLGLGHLILCVSLRNGAENAAFWGAFQCLRPVEAILLSVLGIATAREKRSGFATTDLFVFEGIPFQGTVSEAISLSDLGIATARVKRSGFATTDLFAFELVLRFAGRILFNAQQQIDAFSQDLQQEEIQCALRQVGEEDHQDIGDGIAIQ